MQNWISVKDRMPAQLEDILYVTKGGEINKGCLNLRDTWIIQNTDGLIPRYFRDSSCITHWMPLPGREENWIKQGDKAPEPGSRILSRDRIDGHVVIVDVLSNCWIIRNDKDDHITFTIWNHPDNLWMPLPETPAA